MQQAPSLKCLLIISSFFCNSLAWVFTIHSPPCCRSWLKRAATLLPKHTFQLRNAPATRIAPSSPLGRCASHICEAVHSALGGSAVQSNYTIVLCAGNKTDTKYGPCSVLPCMVSHAVFKSGESKPCLFFSFSASSWFHLPRVLTTLPQLLH